MLPALRCWRARSSLFSPRRSMMLARAERRDDTELAIFFPYDALLCWICRAESIYI